MSNKCNTLFVFEGIKTENDIVAKMEKHFVGKSMAVKCVFDAEIYQLYRILKREDFAIDVVSLLKERNVLNYKELEGYDSDSFSYIYLFFDYDAHATKASDEQLVELIGFFDNETDNGKLFVSYPMVEAIRHYKDADTFKDLVVKCKRGNCPNLNSCHEKESCLAEPHYKSFVPTDNTPRYANLNSTKIWQELIDVHLCKSNYLINDSFLRPESLIKQSEILDRQISKHLSKDCPVVAVLSAFPMFLQDFYGVDGLNKKLRVV